MYCLDSISDSYRPCPYMVICDESEKAFTITIFTNNSVISNLDELKELQSINNKVPAFKVQSY